MATMDEPRRRRFPADIEAEILLRLPVKTLIRFKIACKQWPSLISSPQFQKSHHRHTLLTLHSEENIETLRYNNGFHIANFSKFLRLSAFNTNRLTLQNPHTTSVRRQYLHAVLYALNLGAQSFQLYSYAILLLATSSPKSTMTVWVSGFDIDTEQYTKHIPLPAFGSTFEIHIILELKCFMFLTILGGFLCLTVDYGEPNCLMELWLLKDYNNVQWVKGYTIDVSSVYPYPSCFFRAYPADNMVDECILLNCFDEQGVKLLAYDPQNGRVIVKKAKERAATFYEETLYSLIS